MVGDSDLLEHGVQPLDAVMNQLGLKNADLVAVSAEFLTHKQVNKARRGRRLTTPVQIKILNALNKLSPDKKYRREDLFSY